MPSVQQRLIHLSPELTLSAMQGFLQRCQNYLSKTVVEQVIMRLARNNHQQFMQEAGLRVRAYEQGFSTSAAAISAADWALEYPHPIPPKVHVSLHHSAHMHLVTSLCRGCQVHTHITIAVHCHATHLSFWCLASQLHQNKDNAKKVKGFCQRISINLYQKRVYNKAKTKQGHNVISSCVLQPVMRSQQSPHVSPQPLEHHQLMAA